MPHKPVLLKEFLSFFEGRILNSFVDGTVGAGGHARALLEAHPELTRFYGIDQDPDSLAIATQTLEPFKERVTLLSGNFRHLNRLIPHKVDGIFLDIGVSSMQLDRAEKGFSFTKDGPLDMRMDPTAKLDAATIVNTFSEKELSAIFWEYGEEKRARKAAKAIVDARKKKKIRTTLELCEVLKPVLTWSGRERRHIHPMTLVFQALRIKVNEELKAIEEAITQAIALLNPQGRLGIISFHSLEDRIVKEEFRKQKGAHLILTKKPLVASEEEERENPRSRSAKMRFLEV